MFTYYLKDKLHDKKEKRQAAEKEAVKKISRFPIPRTTNCGQKPRLPKPELYLMVYDQSGAPDTAGRRLVDAGFHRVAWDLRYSGADGESWR